MITTFDGDDDDDIDDDDDDDGFVMMVLWWWGMFVLTVLWWWCWGKMIMTKYAWHQLVGKNPLQVLSGIGGVCPHGVCPHAGVLVVSQLYFGGHWRLGGILAVCPSILTVFSDVLGLAHVFVVFLWCLRGVPVVFWWYWRNGISWAKMAHMSISNWHQRRCDALLLGLYDG